jgi:hypothetical protein
MKQVSIALSILILVIAASAFAGEDSTRSAGIPKLEGKPVVSAATTPDSSEASQPAVHQVIAYYFHGTRRCSNCIKIESYTKEAIDSAYGAALKDSSLVWRVVNTDEEANNHFLDDYQLYTKSVVLVDMQDGKQVRWKNLEKVWDYLGDKEAFKKYIRDEVALFLKAD